VGSGLGFAAWLVQELNHTKLFFNGYLGASGAPGATTFRVSVAPRVQRIAKKKLSFSLEFSKKMFNFATEWEGPTRQK
jgi:hypothetical protein